MVLVAAAVVAAAPEADSRNIRHCAGVTLVGKEEK